MGHATRRQGTSATFGRRQGALLLLVLGAATCSRGGSPGGAVEDKRSALLGPQQLGISLPSGAGLLGVGLAATNSLRIANSVTMTAPSTGFASAISTGTTATSVGTDTRLINVISQVARDDSRSVRAERLRPERLDGVADQRRHRGGRAQAEHAADAAAEPHLDGERAGPTGGDVSLEPDQTRPPLAPGSYHAVTAKTRAVLPLAAGTFFFDSLDIEPLATLNVSAGPVFIYVATSLLLKGNIQAGQQDQKFFIGFFGTSQVSLESAFTGTIVAPNAMLRFAPLNGAGSFTGQFFARDINVEASDTIVLRPFLGWGKLSSPPRARSGRRSPDPDVRGAPVGQRIPSAVRILQRQPRALAGGRGGRKHLHAGPRRTRTDPAVLSREDRRRLRDTVRGRGHHLDDTGGIGDGDGAEPGLSEHGVLARLRCRRGVRRWKLRDHVRRRALWRRRGVQQLPGRLRLPRRHGLRSQRLRVRREEAMTLVRTSASWILTAALLPTFVAARAATAAPTKVTGADPTTAAGQQAETAYNLSVVNGQRIETVTSDDETDEIPNFVTYTDSSRTVFRGYSLVGWSYRIRTAQNPNPPFTHAPKLRPPSGWAVLWGDPSIASNPDLPNVVLIGKSGGSGREVPERRHHGRGRRKFARRSAEAASPGRPTGDSRSRSRAASPTPGRSTASTDTCTGFEPTKGHFFDGSSVAITRSGNTFTGYAAFVDSDLASRPSIE